MHAAYVSVALAVAALFAGPLLLWITNGSPRWRAALDGLVLALVAGICLLHLGPHTLAHGGLLAMFGVIAGAALPTWLHRDDHGALWTGSAIGILGVHAVMDGIGLAVADAGISGGIAAAVIAHRLPVGLAVTLAAGRPSRAASVLIGMTALTLGGFAAASTLGPTLPEPAHALVEGLIVGAVLHVVFSHRVLPVREAAYASEPITPGSIATAISPPSPTSTLVFSPSQAGPMLATPTDTCSHIGCNHGHDHHGQDHGLGSVSGNQADRQSNALGAIAGTLTLVLLATQATDTPDLAHLEATGKAFVSLFLTSAPALLAGFLIAGLLSAGLDASHARWLASGSKAQQAVRGVAFGLPLPVCSCGVVPMYESLIRRGVPVTAALAFLVATPELGLDAVFLSVPLLGMPLTVARVVAAFVVAIAVAWLVGRNAPAALPLAPQAGRIRRPLAERLRDGLRFGLCDLVDHTLPWILAGLLIAALAEPLLDHTALAALPPALQVPIAALVGIPLYVCASGATPLAAVAVHKGLSAGAALTFLLAGPATNVTTFGMLSALHGRRLAIRFGLALTVSAVFAGWGVDLLGMKLPELAHPGAVHAAHTDALGIAAGIALTALAAASLWRQGARGMVDQVLNPVHVH